VATGEMEILLEIGGFDVDGDVEMTMIQAHMTSRVLTWEEEICQGNLMG
jgi:hypothetical protein